MEREHTPSSMASVIPQTLEEAIHAAKQLGIPEDFARQEYHAKKAVGWKDGYKNPIVSWPDHLQVRWLIEQRKRVERQARVRARGKRPPSPQRQFNAGDYNQSLKEF